MRIKITKSLKHSAQASNRENPSEDSFPAGEYLANLTSEGKI